MKMHDENTLMAGVSINASKKCLWGESVQRVKELL
jgi:hypothetical protein